MRIYPIMHAIAMRKDVLAEHPWLARNLYLAFEPSKTQRLQGCAMPSRPHAR